MSTWHEIIVVGGEKALRGFVAGFIGGRAGNDAVLIGRDLGVQSTSLGEALHDLLVGGSHHVLLVPDPVVAALITALQRSGAAAELRLERQSEVVAAGFEFKAEAFSPEVAESIEAALHKSLPAGVTVDAFEEQEETDGDARGAELYSPAHDYTYRAAGRVHGALPGVLEMYRRAKDIDFVDAEPVRIETTEIS